MENPFWHPEKGATCPKCGKERVPVSSSRPWDDGIKIRHHRCPCGETFKSVQLSEEERAREIMKSLEKIDENTRLVDMEREKLERILNYS